MNCDEADVLLTADADGEIDVFVRPEGARPLAPSLRTVRGFNVASAHGAEMEWLATSVPMPCRSSSRSWRADRWRRQWSEIQDSASNRVWPYDSHSVAFQGVLP